MTVSDHIKQGILHYLLIVSKYPHVQSLLPENDVGEKELIEIMRQGAYFLLTKESRFFFITISVFACNNYVPVKDVFPKEKLDVIDPLPADERDSKPPIIDETVQDLLAQAMPRK